MALFKESKAVEGEAMALGVVARASLAAKKGLDAVRAANEALQLLEGGALEAKGLLLVAKTKQVRVLTHFHSFWAMFMQF